MNLATRLRSSFRSPLQFHTYPISIRNLHHASTMHSVSRASLFHNAMVRKSIAPYSFLSAKTFLVASFCFQRGSCAPISTRVCLSTHHQGSGPSRSTIPSSLPPTEPKPSHRALSPQIFLLSHVPKPPLYLGFAGLIPFISTTLCTYLASAEDFISFQLLQATYGASILCFLGAVHWGTAMAKYGDPSSVTTRYTLSVAPCILGFITLSCPPTTALLAQLLGFQFLLFGDFVAWRHRNVPEWYLNLRIWLTSIVSLCLLGSLWAPLYHVSLEDRKNEVESEKEVEK